MKRVLVLAIALMLTACAASGVHVDESQVTEFKKGQTSYDEVVSQLGSPTQKTIDSSGNVEISYIYSEYQTRPESFIPYVGGLVGGADTRINTALFKFNSSGVLQDYTFSETAIGTGMNLSAGVSPARVPVKPRTD